MAEYVAYLRSPVVTRRVSPTLFQQRILINDWARRNGHTITRYYEEQGSDGRSLGRPKLADLLADAARGHARNVVVSDLDRLSPDADLQAHILAELHRYGCVVVSVRP